jgi:drug/metabolite transporter (DMT)-like permease
MALAVSVIIAISITIIRRSRSDQSMSAASGGLLAAAATAWFSHPAMLGLHSWEWLGLNGLLVMPTSAALLMYAPRYVPGPLVAMFYLLETVLTPIWMWLVFDETPSLASLIGGIIVIVSLVSHSLYMLVVDKNSSHPRTVTATRPLQIATTLPD